MLKHYLLALSLLAAGSAVAQSQHSFSFLPQSKTVKEKQHRNFVKQMLLHNPVIVAKTTVTKERVIAMTNLQDLYTDSINFTYSGTHGSAYDYNQLDYIFYTPYTDGPMIDEYNYHQNAPSVLFDTTTWYTIDGSNNNATNLSEILTAGYDVNANMTSYTDSMDEYNYIEDYYSFNPQNTINYRVELQYSSASTLFDTSMNTFYTYDSQQRLIEDSTNAYSNGTWQPYTKNTYNYNNAGNLSAVYSYDWNSMNWDTTERYVITYYGNNKVKTIADDTYTGIWSPSYFDTLGYTGNVAFNTYWAELDLNNGTDTSFIISKHLNAQNLPDTMYINEQFGAPEIAYMSYDSYNNPTQISVYETDSMSVPYITIHYYYETYDLGVAHVQAPDDFKVYPNPAGNNIYISSQKYAGRQLVATLINSLGQTIEEATFTSSGSYELSLVNVKAGMYWITIHSDDGNCIHKQAIVKQ